MRRESHRRQRPLYIYYIIHFRCKDATLDTAARLCATKAAVCVHGAGKTLKWVESRLLVLLLLLLLQKDTITISTFQNTAPAATGGRESTRPPGRHGWLQMMLLLPGPAVRWSRLVACFCEKYKKHKQNNTGCHYRDRQCGAVD